MRVVLFRVAPQQIYLALHVAVAEMNSTCVGWVTEMNVLEDDSSFNDYASTREGLSCTSSSDDLAAPSTTSFFFLFCLLYFTIPSFLFFFSFKTNISVEPRVTY